MVGNFDILVENLIHNNMRIQLFPGLNSELPSNLHIMHSVERTHTHTPPTLTPTRIQRQLWTHNFCKYFTDNEDPQPQLFTIQMWTVLRVNCLTMDLVLDLP